MSVSPGRHLRTLPDVDISERGLRQLEIWLKRESLLEWEDVGTGATTTPTTPTLSYSDHIFANLTSNLIGYWRLGETGSPWADTSGAAGGPRNMTLATSGTPTALTPDVTGALATDDDGAVRFNYDGGSSTGGQYLQASPVSSSGFWNLNHMTAAAFFKTAAATGPRKATILGSMAYSAVGDGYYAGWHLRTAYPALPVYFSRGQPDAIGGEKVASTPGVIDADTWYHVAGTYDGANIKLYMNGVLVNTTADTSDVPVGVNSYCQIGYETLNFENSWLVGTVDEAAVWDIALTADQIAALYISSGLV